MNYYWKVVETRIELLQMKLNELQASGHEIVKVDLLSWDEKLRTGHYNIIARQMASTPAARSAIPAY